MTTWEILAVVALCLVAILGTITAWLLVVLHQRRILGEVGGLPVGMRRGASRWGIGVGRYRGDEFLWYRTWTLRTSPTMRMPRAEVEVLAHRPADPERDSALRPHSSVVECDFRGEHLSLGFSDDALTGFLSWLEASAPRF